MTSGYWTMLLRVDLTERRSWVQSIAEAWCQKYVGGSGFGTKILWDETEANIEPLGPDNIIIFGVGPFQGHGIPGAAKWSIVSKSPLTGTYGESNVGGSWGAPKFRKCGYDSLVIHGRADSPVYMWITDDKVEIRDASAFWGMDTSTAVSALKQDVGDSQASVAVIGPAGERLVRIACVCADAHSFAGRCGLGAVMGAKNLKAVVVSGRLVPPTKESEALPELTRALFKQIYDETEENEFRLHGTAGLMTVAEGIGDAPIKYWQGDVWPEGAEKIGAPRFTDVLKIRPKGCIYCPIQCHRQLGVRDSEGKSFTSAGPQYETLGMFGSNCLVDDVWAIAKANEMANLLGIDTISAGAMVGFAMECRERGWLSSVDTGGIDLAWGNGEALIEMVRQIGLREGFGGFFADGTLAAAEKIGPHAVDIVAHVRGLDLPAHDPRACFSLAPNYATSTRGACHLRGNPEDAEMGAFLAPEIGISDQPKFFEVEGKSDLAVKTQNITAMLNSLVNCMFMFAGGGMSLTEHVSCLEAITGWGWQIQEFMEAGERIYNLQRLINIRDGVGPDHDKLPVRMFEPAQKGFRQGQVPPMVPLLQEFYALRGWDVGGNPKPETLQRLDLQ